MAAEIKSHVLRRDEKGFMGIPFKRLLLAAVTGGLAFSVVRFAWPSMSVPLALVCGLLALTLTATRGGLPRWQRLTYHWRGALLLAAARAPQGALARLRDAIGLPADLVTLDGEQLFRTPEATRASADLGEWVTFARAQEADHADGFALLENPLGGGRR